MLRFLGVLPASLVVVSVLTSVTLAINYDDPRYALQTRDKPDREEGIERVRTSGARLTLISAFITANDLTPTPTPAVYRLGFFLNETANPSLEVRSNRLLPGRYVYWMRPRSTSYSPRFNEFAWDARLVNELGMAKEDLGAVAVIDQQGHHLLAPLLLHTDVFPDRIRASELLFVFAPHQTMEVEYRIVSRNNPSHIFLREARVQWVKDVIKSIRWDGTNNLIEPRREAPSGNYILYLDATVVENGRPARLPFDWEFNYQRDNEIRKR